MADPGAPPRSDAPIDEQKAHAAHLARISPKRTALNVVGNYGRAAITMLLGLVLQGYLVRSLGKAEYALWPLIGSCTALAALIPRGIGAGVARFLAHALGEGEVDEIERITTSAFVGLTGGALAYAGVVVVLSVGFESIFDVPAGTEGLGGWAMLLAGLAGALSVPFGVFQGGLSASQQFVKLNALRTVTYVARVVLIVGLFVLDEPRLLWVGLAFFVIAVIDSVALAVLARRAVPWQRLRRAAFDWGVLRRVSTFSGWFLISSMAGLLYWHTDNFIINKLIDPTQVAGYAIVVSLVNAAYQVMVLGCQALTPAFTVMHAQGDIARMVRVVYRTNRTIVPLAVLPIVFAMINGEEILVLYVGEAFREYGVLFWLIGGGVLVAATNQVTNSVPVAFGRMRAASMAMFAGALVNVVLSVVFAFGFGWGLLGVAGGTLATWVIYKLIFWSWLVAHMMGVRLGPFMASATLRPWAIAAPGIACLVAARWLDIGHGLFGLAAVGLFAAAVEGVFLATVGLDPIDRKWVRDRLGRLARRGRPG